MSALDIRVAQALASLRLVERALHDHSAWSMEYAGVRVPVSRFIREDRVSFVGHFEPMCLIEDAPVEVGLYCEDQLVRMISLPEPISEDGGQVWFDLMISTPVRV